jgi:hypothetical protein
VRVRSLPHRNGVGQQASSRGGQHQQPAAPIGRVRLLMSLNRPQAPTMNAVAGLLAMDRTTLTAALKPLARRALVRVKDFVRRHDEYQETPRAYACGAGAAPIRTPVDGAQRGG